MRSFFTFLLLLALHPSDARADALAQEIDRLAAQVLKETGSPSVSVAVVDGGQLVYAQAYGVTNVKTKAKATPKTRYAIGSVSKQLTSAAILLLAEEGKLKLDDPVARFLPGIARGSELKIRDLLNHTAGLTDWWPQDFVPPFMETETTGEKIIERWGAKLDFDPGTQWAYSNTGYTAAGLIVEKITGAPLHDALKRRLFVPLRMETVVDVARARLSEPDPIGYTRHALAPLKEAPSEANGWLFATAGLAMTPSDLAKWNIAMIEQKVLSPSSWGQLTRETLLKSGAGTNYGLGVRVFMSSDRRVIAHDGAVSGFLATNVIYPDDGVAVTVFTNDDSRDAAAALANKILPLLVDGKDKRTESEKKAKLVFEQLQKGKLDRALFTDNGNAFFNEATLKDYAASLKKVGAVTKIEQTRQKWRGGMLMREMKVVTKSKTLHVLLRELPDGKLEQFIVSGD